MKVKEIYKDYLQISNSRQEGFNHCPRKYYWSHERALQIARGNSAMRYGRVWHSALDTYYSHVKKYGWNKPDPAGVSAETKAADEILRSWEEETPEHLEFADDHRTIAHMAEALVLYFDSYREDENVLKVLQAEQKYEIPLIMTPDEIEKFPKLKDEKILLTGIIDLVASEHGHVWVYEHKTTGAYLANIMHTNHRSTQIIGYYYAASALYPDLCVQGVMVNVAHLSARKLKSGDWGTRKIEFRRAPEIFSTGDLREWRYSLLETVNRILDYRKRNFWPMNMGSCYLYNSTCQYAELCEQTKIDLNSVITDNFETREL